MFCLNHRSIKVTLFSEIHIKIISKISLTYHQIAFPERTRDARSLSRHSSKSQASLDLDSLLTQKSPSRIDCIYLIWTDSSDRPDITDKNIVFCFTAFPNFTPQSSSYTVVNPSGWQTRKCESVTSIHPRWQNQYFQPCFADKFVTEITILHEKSGNETIFITAKNERLL